MITNIQISNQLTVILSTYESITAFFYQKILQTTYTNNQLAVYNVDYTLLLPSSEFIVNLNAAQVNAQMQAYIDLCNVLVLEITTNINTQTTLFYEQIQNTLNTSIAQLNGFSIALLDAQYKSLFQYKLPYSMGMIEALWLNNIDLSTYPLQARLNYNVQDFNNLLQNTIIVLSR
jgi:ribonuclease PH